MFNEYEHFLLVIGSAVRPIQWFGLIESKIRHFINNLEKDSYRTLRYTHLLKTVPEVKSSAIVGTPGFGRSRSSSGRTTTR